MNSRDSKLTAIVPGPFAVARTSRQKQAPATAREAQAIIESIADFYGTWDFSSPEFCFSDTWLASLGYSPSDLSHEQGFFERFIHPDDRTVFESELKAHLAGRVPVWNCECRIQNKAGEYQWFEIRGKAIPNKRSGEPAQLAGMVLNIDARKRQNEQATDRKNAGEALRESEERLRIAIESGPIYAFEWNPVTDVVQRSSQATGILDLSESNSPHTKQELIEGIHLDDKDRYVQILKSVSTQNPSYKTIFRYTRPDRKMIWLQETGRAFFAEDGSIRKVLGITSDVTEIRRSEQTLRELSQRLISSQEDERRRIARELHDNIGQKLALLCIQAQRVDSGEAQEEHTDRDDVHELYEKIKIIASDISKLSHRLHSSELNFLGLGVAAERLCRDFQVQSGIDIQFTAKNLPSKLDSGKSLCLYRVLQEALQNVVKHSHATRALVDLQNKKDELILKVSDNGKGFDTDSFDFGQGLGLMSVRERLNLVGGLFALSSKTGSGTTLTASVRI